MPTIFEVQPGSSSDDEPDSCLEEGSQNLLARSAGSQITSATAHRERSVLRSAAFVLSVTASIALLVCFSRTEMMTAISPSETVRLDGASTYITDVRDVAKGSICSPNTWLGVQSDAFACMDEVERHSECVHTYFNFDEDGNCGCVKEDVDCTDPSHQTQRSEARIYQFGKSASSSEVSKPKQAFDETVLPIEMRSPDGSLEASHIAHDENLFIITHSIDRNAVVYDVVDGHIKGYWRQCQKASAKQAAALHCPREAMLWIEKQFAFGFTVERNTMSLACCKALPIQLGKVGSKHVARVNIAGESMVLQYIHLMLGGWNLAVGGLRYVELHGTSGGRPVCFKLEINMQISGMC